MKAEKTNPKAEARKLIAAADKKHLTIVGGAIMQYIVMFVGFVLAECEDTKKRLYDISSRDILAETLNFIHQAKGATVYPSDYALLTDYYRAIRNYVLAIVNRKEAEYIIKNLKESETFCNNFFYGSKIHGGNINMRPIVSKLVYELRTSYHIVIDERDVASIIYVFFWDEGTWSKLDGFRFESSFFCWLETISRREVVKYLEEQRYINIQKEKTSGNMRVNLMSQQPERCKMIIEEEIHTEVDRLLLLYIYYNRYDEATIQKLMHLNGDEYKAAAKKAEKKLIEAMLCSTQSYDDILRLKDPRDITVSTEAAVNIIGWLEYKIGDSSLQDIFGLNLSDKEIQECAQNLLHTVSAAMPWQERDRYIFFGRYFANADPVEMANELGVTRAYIDTRFSRLQERFNKALREWAVEMKLITRDDVAAIERRIKANKAKGRNKEQ